MPNIAMELAGRDVDDGRVDDAQRLRMTGPSHDETGEQQNESLHSHDAQRPDPLMPSVSLGPVHVGRRAGTENCERIACSGHSLSSTVHPSSRTIGVHIRAPWSTRGGND